MEPTASIAPSLVPIARDRLGRFDETDAAPEVRAHVRRLVKEGDDVDLYKINAYAFADATGVELPDALRGLLYATRLGVFDLNYDVYCPDCRGNTEYVGQLMGLSGRSHCNLCRIDFELDFLEQVEVTFTVNPDVRSIDFDDFSERDFMGKKRWFEQVAGRHGRLPELSALFEAPGETLPMEATLEAGTYQLYVPSAHDGAVTITVEGAPVEAPQRATLVADEDGRVSISRRAFRPGPIAIEATSRYPRPHWPVLGLGVGLPSRWVSAAYVTSQQDFRDLFAGEFLAPDASFAIRSTTLMFTDIRSSTEMFEELGDSAAFALVQDHFRVMTEIIRRRRGGIVKTIGDAVMAAFPCNADAVTAAAEIQATFGAEPVKDRYIEVKIGLHRGPTIAVTSNRNLDYFGRTVNMAARVQGCSGPGEILLSEDVVRDPAVAWLLGEVAADHDVIEASLKGIGDGFRLHRIRPRAAAAA